MPPKRKYSGVLQTVSNTSSQVIHFLSVEILSSLQSLFAIWEYTATCPWLACRRLYPVILQLCDRYTASVVPSVSQCYSVITSLMLSRLDYSSVKCKPHRNISMLNCRIICSQCLMWQQDWYAMAENTTILHLCCVICNGCTSQNVLRSIWLFLCSSAAIVRHQNTW